MQKQTGPGCRKKYWSRLQRTASEQWASGADWTAPVVQFAETMANTGIVLSMAFTAVLRSISTWKQPCEEKCTSATVSSTCDSSDEPVLCTYYLKCQRIFSTWHTVLSLNAACWTVSYYLPVLYSVKCAQNYKQILIFHLKVTGIKKG